MDTLITIILAIFATIGVTVVAIFIVGWALGWDNECDCVDSFNIEYDKIILADLKKNKKIKKITKK